MKGKIESFQGMDVLLVKRRMVAGVEQVGCKNSFRPVLGNKGPYGNHNDVDAKKYIA